MRIDRFELLCILFPLKYIVTNFQKDCESLHYIFIIIGNHRKSMIIAKMLLFTDEEGIDILDPILMII